MTTLPPDWPDWGLSDASLDWQERGLCAQADPKAFFPESGVNATEAKRACAECGVRAECLAYALVHGERFGIWGGLAPRERRKLKRPAQPTPLVAVATKPCTGCETEKPRTEFYRATAGGVQSRCKCCVKAAKRARLAEQRDRAGAA